jgi:hypothetical protein
VFRSKEDREDFKQHHHPLVQLFLGLGFYLSPVSLGFGAIHIVGRFFEGIPPAGDWISAMIWSAISLLYLINRYGTFWRK